MWAALVPSSDVLLPGHSVPASPKAHLLTFNAHNKAGLTSATVASGSVGNLAKPGFLSLGQRALPRCGSSGLAGHMASDHMTMLLQAQASTPLGQVEGGTLHTDSSVHPGQSVPLGRYQEHR